VSDKCQLCRGKRSGVPGNENVVQLAGLDVVVCDYCHVALTPQRTAVLPQFSRVWASDGRLFAVAVGGTVWEWHDENDRGGRGWNHLDGVQGEQ